MEATQEKTLQHETTETIETEQAITPFAELDDNVKLALACASEKKAFDMIALDLREIASFTEFFIICSGANQRQVQAISDEINEQLKKQLKSKAILHRQNGELGETIYDEIVLAATTLSTEKTGALIVIQRNVGLRNFIDAGVQLDAKISYDLLVTIFNPATPLHDGAVIIHNERLAAASVFLPLTKNPGISRELGTRHRAAIGITEGTDAVSVIVSEETGLISFVENGTLLRNLDTPTLRNLLLEAMNLPVIETKREPTKTMKEPETEITVG
jgi:uncharacterized protein (TIGR00159 family)